MPGPLGKGKGRGGAGNDEAKGGGGLFEKQVEKRVQPVVAALDRFRPALEDNTRQLKELTKALKEGR